MCFLGINKFAADRRGTPKDHDSSPLINRIAGRLLKNDEMQGVRILRNEAYMHYAAMTTEEAQRRRSRFSTAC